MVFVFKKKREENIFFKFKDKIKQSKNIQTIPLLAKFNFWH